MSEDWEADSEVIAPSPQGRIFGMRGRGFRPVEKVVGLQNGKNRNYEDKENDSHGNNSAMVNKGYRNSNNDEDGAYEDNWCDDSHQLPLQKLSYKDQDCQRNRNEKLEGGISDNFDDERKGKPKRQDYIPQEISDNADELFCGGISSGINFSKYDDVEVKVSGENIPKKIERFEEAGLCSTLLSNIERCSYKKPTPIQKYALPIVMNGRDMMACAQTGSGKTAAFLIPLIHRLLQDGNFSIEVDGMATPQLLVVTPTRELGIQIHVEARKFTFGSKLKTEICYGGTSVRYQKDKIREGCNILVATPGRLKDFLQRKVVSLQEVRYFVLDEADRMLDMSFLPDIEGFLTHPTNNENNKQQILMFSATFPEDVQRLATKFLKNYLFLAVGIVGGACTDVEQRFYSISKFDKRPKLIELLEELGSGKTLVFVEKKRTADIIAAFLSEKDFPATSMHGDREQILREEALNDFKSGKMDILVATAVAARGLGKLGKRIKYCLPYTLPGTTLTPMAPVGRFSRCALTFSDIKDVSHVINFDLPQSVDEYVHRIGRTGRVGNRGLATSFYDPQADASLAPALVRILTQAEQEVPDFLQEAANGSTWYSDKGSKFGGRDIRRRGPRENDRQPVLEAAVTYEEDVW